MSLLPPLNRGINTTQFPISQRILHALTTCTSAADLRSLQSLILIHRLQSNTSIAAAFFAAASSLSCLRPALSLFSSITSPPHIFVCNSLLRALLPHRPLYLLPLFSRFLSLSVSPNRYTFPLLLKPLAPLHLQRAGQMLHSQAFKFGLSLHTHTANSFLNFYSVCADLHSAHKLFDEMPVREVVAWSTIIAAHRNAACHDDALVVLDQMMGAGVSPNRVTMINALAACASSGALQKGEWIHDYINHCRWEVDVVLGTSLVNMYGKCGKIDSGLSVFVSMQDKNVYTWNSLIGGFALAKSGEEAIRWFLKMQREGFEPDKVTLIEALCACSHSGMVEIGKMIFHSLVTRRYGFCPSVKHYGCMVDLLGRSGHIADALECIERMPYEPNAYMWGSLLAECRARGNLAMSEFLLKKLMELDPQNVGHYVVLYNLYAEMGRWMLAEEVRRVMKEMGLRKDLGWSLADNRLLAVATG